MATQLRNAAQRARAPFRHCGDHAISRTRLSPAPTSTPLLFFYGCKGQRINVCSRGGEPGDEAVRLRDGCNSACGSVYDVTSCIVALRNSRGVYRLFPRCPLAYKRGGARHIVRGSLLHQTVFPGSSACVIMEKTVWYTRIVQRHEARTISLPRP